MWGWTLFINDIIEALSTSYELRKIILNLSGSGLALENYIKAWISPFLVEILGFEYTNLCVHIDVSVPKFKKCGL